MDIVYTAFFFVLGLAMGSFYHVAGMRVPLNESIVRPGSSCKSCNRRLTAIDLVPVLSYLWLGGKCRTCKAKISSRYMWMELLTGGLFAYAYGMAGCSLELATALLFVSLIITITVSDLVYMLIPNKILLFFLPLLALGRILSPLDPWWDSLLGAVCGAGLLWLIAVASKGGMGGGDIKLFFLIGLVLGTGKTLLTLFIAAIIGLLLGAIVLRIRKQGHKTPIPFGPFIGFAALICYFYGDFMIDWYLNL